MKDNEDLMTNTVLGRLIENFVQQLLTKFDLIILVDVIYINYFQVKKMKD